MYREETKENYNNNFEHFSDKGHVFLNSVANFVLCFKTNHLKTLNIYNFLKYIMLKEFKNLKILHV